MLLLERLGLTPDDLAAACSARREVPTFADYVPVVSASVNAGTRRAHGARVPKGEAALACRPDGPIFASGLDVPGVRFRRRTRC